MKRCGPLCSINAFGPHVANVRYPILLQERRRRTVDEKLADHDRRLSRWEDLLDEDGCRAGRADGG